MINHWIDLKSGQLVVGQDEHDKLVSQTGSARASLRPVAELLLADKFDVDTSLIPPYPRRKTYSGEECRAQGALILGIVQEIDPESSITNTHLERAHHLGLTATHRTIVAHTGGSIWALRDALGAPRFTPHGSFNDWTVDQFVENAQALARTLGRSPRIRDFRDWAKKGNGPSERAVLEFFPGGMRALSEWLGKPNIRSWDEDDYVEWGVRFMHANNGLTPTVLTSKISASRGRGPTHKTISLNFPGGYKEFKTRVTEIYNQQLKDYETRLAQHTKDLDALAVLLRQSGKELPEKPLDLLARYQVAAECLRETPPIAVAALAATTPNKDLVAAIQKKDPALSAGRVEIVAVGLNWYDEIWPPYPDDMRKLRISPSELAAAKRQAAVEIRRMRKKLRKKPTTQPQEQRQFKTA